MKQRVTFTRSATVFSAATGHEIYVEAGAHAWVELGGGPLTSPNGWYKLTIEGRRTSPGWEPRIRVHRLHQATMHPEPLYRICDSCHGLGRTQHVRIPGFRGKQYVSEPVPCPECTGNGHTKKYPPKV